MEVPKGLEGIPSIQSGRFRPIVAFIVLPLVALTVSNLISVFAYEWTGILLVLSIVASAVLYLSASGPIFVYIIAIGGEGTTLSPKYFLKSLPNLWEKHSKEYFEKRGEKDAIIEIQYITKILYLAIALLITLIVLYSANLVYDEYLKPVVEYLKPILGANFLLRAAQILVVYVLFLLFFMVEFFITRDFRFYFASACITVASLPLADEVTKMKYLILGLSSYNKYLRRILKQQFDENKVNSFIIGGKMQEIINLLIKAFKLNNGETRINKLRPAEVLSNLLIDKSEFLVKEKIGQGILDWGGLFIGLIPVVITISGLLFQRYFPSSGK